MLIVLKNCILTLTDFKFLGLCDVCVEVPTLPPPSTLPKSLY